MGLWASQHSKYILHPSGSLLGKQGPHHSCDFYTGRELFASLDRAEAILGKQLTEVNMLVLPTAIMGSVDYGAEGCAHACMVWALIRVLLSPASDESALRNPACTPAQADVRLFQTLIRFDHVYVVRSDGPE